MNYYESKKVMFSASPLDQELCPCMDPVGSTAHRPPIQKIQSGPKSGTPVLILRITSVNVHRF